MKKRRQKKRILLQSHKVTHFFGTVSHKETKREKKVKEKRKQEETEKERTDGMRMNERQT